MERQFSNVVAWHASRPIGKVRQTLRALRESGLVPGHGVRPSSTNIARIVIALAAEGPQAAPGFVTAVRTLPLRTACGMPSTAEAALARIVDAIPVTPIIDELDLDDGVIHIGATALAIECLSIVGKRAVVRYGEPAATINTSTSIPVATVRDLVEGIRSTK